MTTQPYETHQTHCPPRTRIGFRINCYLWSLPSLPFCSFRPSSAGRSSQEPRASRRLRRKYPLEPLRHLRPQYRPCRRKHQTQRRGCGTRAFRCLLSRAHADARLADRMDVFHSHFRYEFDRVYKLCDGGFHKEGMTLPRFIRQAQELHQHLHMHHTIVG